MVAALLNRARLWRNLGSHQRWSVMLANLDLDLAPNLDLDHAPIAVFLLSTILLIFRTGFPACFSAGMTCVEFAQPQMEVGFSYSLVFPATLVGALGALASLSILLPVSLAVSAEF